MQHLRRCSDARRVAGVETRVVMIPPWIRNRLLNGMTKRIRRQSIRFGADSLDSDLDYYPEKL